MTTTELRNEHVASQYEKWVYPLPIMDLSAPEHEGKTDGGDPNILFHAYWPSETFTEDLDILVAGCGSNSAARYAFKHPKARVTGIDLSSSSLAHEQYLKEKHNLTNLTLHQGRIEEVTSLGKDFDFIEVAGVLHHLPNPAEGLTALRKVLRPNGVIFIMLYGKYGRTGVYMMQELFRLMGLEQRQEDVELIKKTLSVMAQNHAIKPYLSKAPDLGYDAGIVDTFLHRQDRAYTVLDCLTLTEEAGLKFQGWRENILYYPEAQLPMAHPLREKLNKLDEQSIWQAMELFNGTLGQHCFYVCHKDRDPASYEIRFEGEAFLDYVPVINCARVPNEEKEKQGCITIKQGRFPAITLDKLSSVLFHQIDGTRTVRECLKKTGIKADSKGLLEGCRTTFQFLWRVGYIFLKKQA